MYLGHITNPDKLRRQGCRAQREDPGNTFFCTVGADAGEEKK